MAQIIVLTIIVLVVFVIPAASVWLKNHRHGGVQAGIYGGTRVYAESGYLYVHGRSRHLGVPLDRITGVTHNDSSVTVHVSGMPPQRFRANRAAHVAEYIRQVSS